MGVRPAGCLTKPLGQLHHETNTSLRDPLARLRSPTSRGSSVQSSHLQIDLLGGFRVSVGDAAVGPDAWRRRKPAALVKILALTPGHRLHREQLMELLWPDLDAAPAGANLRKAIYQARGALDAVSQGAGRLIEFVGDVVSLTAVDLTVD